MLVKLMFAKVLQLVNVVAKPDKPVKLPVPVLLKLLHPLTVEVNPVIVVQGKSGIVRKLVQN